MNKAKQESERRRIINLMRESNRKANCLVFYKNETDKHKRLKFEVFIHLQNLGYELYSEIIFKNSNKRADILAIKEGKGYVIECLATETIKECILKITAYPETLTAFLINDIKQINDLPL